MPIKVAIQTYTFKDEEGNPTDATFTIRTRLAHEARNRYMKAISSDMPDLSEVMKDGKLDPDYKPKVSVELIDTMERVLLEYGLVALTNVQDQNGNEIKTWDQFIHHETFYVAQVIKELQTVANLAVKQATPNPNASAPSVVR